MEEGKLGVNLIFFHCKKSGYAKSEFLSRVTTNRHITVQIVTGDPSGVDSHPCTGEEEDTSDCDKKGKDKS